MSSKKARIEKKDPESATALRSGQRSEHLEEAMADMVEGALATAETLGLQQTARARQLFGKIRGNAHMFGAVVGFLRLGEVARLKQVTHTDWTEIKENKFVLLPGALRPFSHLKISATEHETWFQTVANRDACLRAVAQWASTIESMRLYAGRQQVWHSKTSAIFFSSAGFKRLTTLFIERVNLDNELWNAIQVGCPALIDFQCQWSGTSILNRVPMSLPVDKRPWQRFKLGTWPLLIGVTIIAPVQVVLTVANPELVQLEVPALIVDPQHPWSEQDTNTLVTLAPELRHLNLNGFFPTDMAQRGTQIDRVLASFPQLVSPTSDWFRAVDRERLVSERVGEERDFPLLKWSRSKTKSLFLQNTGTLLQPFQDWQGEALIRFLHCYPSLTTLTVEIGDVFRDTTDNMHVNPGESAFVTSMLEKCQSTLTSLDLFVHSYSHNGVYWLRESNSETWEGLAACSFSKLTHFATDIHLSAGRPIPASLLLDSLTFLQLTWFEPTLEHIQQLTTSCPRLTTLRLAFLMDFGRGQQVAHDALPVVVDAYRQQLRDMAWTWGGFAGEARHPGEDSIIRLSVEEIKRVTTCVHLERLETGLVASELKQSLALLDKECKALSTLILRNNTLEQDEWWTRPLRRFVIQRRESVEGDAKHWSACIDAKTEQLPLHFWNEATEHLAAQAPEMRMVENTGQWRVESSLSAVVQFWPRLVYLHVSKLTEPLTNELLTKIGQACPKLQSVTLGTVASKDTLISGNGCIALARSCPALQCLRFYAWFEDKSRLQDRVFSITENDLLDMRRAAPGLRFVEFYGQNAGHSYNSSSYSDTVPSPETLGILLVTREDSRATEWWLESSSNAKTDIGHSQSPRFTDLWFEWLIWPTA